MTSSGHAHFRWCHKTLSSDRPCYPISSSKFSTQLDICFLIYWHSHLEVDDVIEATPTFEDVTKHCPIAGLDTIYRLAKFQVNRAFGTWDVDIHILKLMTSSGHALFWWRHKTLLDGRLCHSISACKVSTQSDIWFLTFIFWSWWRHQATPTFDDVTKIGRVLDLSIYIVLESFISIGHVVPEILTFLFWSWWRHQATPTLVTSQQLGGC